MYLEIDKRIKDTVLSFAIFAMGLIAAVLFFIILCVWRYC
jgi:hypothetical protein